MEPDLTVEFASIKLPNPTILASGILGVSSELMVRAARAGAGAVVTKSFNRKGREGYHNPSFVQVHGGYLNALGIPNPGMEEMKREIANVRMSGVRVIASVFGFDAQEYADAARMGEEGGAMAVELNVSCPHVEEVGIEIGQSPRRVGEVVKAVKRAVNVPVIVKLTPNVTSIEEIGKSAEANGADALSAVNTALGMVIDVEAGRPILSGVTGGLSGPALHPIAVRCVYQLKEAVKIPIIGVGGISDWKDALELMMAGASAVQIGTAVGYKGVGVFEEVNRGITNYLAEHGHDSIREITGIAHKQRVVA